MEEFGPISPGEILALVRTCASSLMEAPQAANGLRHVQRRLDRLQYELLDPDIRFLSFFLYVVVDDFFYNLAGDIPYSQEFNRIQNAAIKRMGEGLLSLAVAFESGDDSEKYRRCRALALGYLDAVEEATKIDDKDRGAAQWVSS